MSEIFDFLKRTESERRRELPRRDEGTELFDIPVLGAEENAPALAEENAPARANDPVFPEPTHSGIEEIGDGKFDLSAVENKLKSVLDPLTLFGEQFRILRSKLALMQKQRGIKTLLVTSSVPREGKTLVASALAGVFAQELGKRVVLLDADMRKPGSGSNMGLNGNSHLGGLSKVLLGEAGFHESLFSSANLQFCFLPSGPVPLNPTELLGSQTLERILKTAAESFDWVVIDSPPVLALSDATLIAPLCDAALVVVRANETPSKLVIEAIQRIGRERICGIVLNRQRHIYSSSYYYRYYRPGSEQKRK